jgi:hypothetical protein
MHRTTPTPTLPTRRKGKKTVVKCLFKLVACFAFVSAFNLKPSFSCSQIAPRPLKIVFSESKAIFRGIVIRAEAIPAPGQLNAKEPILLFPIKVWWHVQEIYKGDHIAGQFGLTMTPFCGGVPISVGSQYIFVIDDSKDASLQGLNAQGSFGVLNEDGTIGPQSEFDTFRSTATKYRELRDRK